MEATYEIMIDRFLDWWDGRLLGGARNPKWREVRAQHIALYPKCAVCNKKSSLLKPNEVHHVQMFNLHPELELDPHNLITLCRPCHLLIGHLGSFKSYNEGVRKDALYLNEKINKRP